MLMYPGPPKREEELAEHVEMWQDKIRRLEAHGEEFKLAPVFKINALRTLMIGKSKEYFDLWEADKDHTDPTKSYEELLAKVKDYSRRNKLDNSAKEKMQHGGDPMDVGAVGGWSWQDDTGGGYDQGDGIYAFAFKGKGKGKGKGDYYNCGASGRYSRECPSPQKGKSKGKGFQGECYNCGEKGHPARECPKGKDGGKSKGKREGYKGKAKVRGAGAKAFGMWTETSRKESGHGNNHRRRGRRGVSSQWGERSRRMSTLTKMATRQSEAENSGAAHAGDLRCGGRGVRRK